MRAFHQLNLNILNDIKIICGVLCTHSRVQQQNNAYNQRNIISCYLLAHKIRSANRIGNVKIFSNLYVITARN